MRTMPIDSSDVWGFNYHPSYASTMMESWMQFDPAIWRHELSLGKQYFPRMNAVRIWLSWDAWCRNAERFTQHFEQALTICAELGVLMVPVLFNRWHDPVCDAGGIYLDQLLPGTERWFQRFGNPFTPYVKSIVQPHAKDARILAWDLCNEPFCCDVNDTMAAQLIPFETAWLSQIHQAVVALDVTQSIGVGAIQDKPIELVNPYCDVLMTHLYFQGDANDANAVKAFDQTVERMAETGKRLGKKWICTECCWGSMNDKVRADRIRVTLEAFKKHHIGFMLYELYASYFADLHMPEDGRLSLDTGMLHFIQRDGSLRSDHDIANTIV